MPSQRACRIPPMSSSPKRHHIELLIELSKARIVSEAMKTFLNYLWWVLDPMLTLLVFYLVFGLLLAKGQEGFLAFLLVGVVSWGWFQKSVSNASTSVLHGRGLMLQVYFPKWLLPASTLIQDALKQGFVMAIVLCYLALEGYANPAWLALPGLMLLQVFLIAGVSGLVAALVPFFPDLRFIVGTGLQLMMFGSGIFYSVEVIPVGYQDWFFLNPMASLIESYRDILLRARLPDADRLLWVCVLAAVFLVPAAILFRRFDHVYPRVVTE